MKSLCTALSIALIFVCSSSGLAVPPEVITFPVPISDVLWDCGDFEILRDAQYTVTQTTFFDNAGEVRRTTWRWDGTETFSNSVTGYSIAGMPFRGLLAFLPDLATTEVQLTRGFFLGGHVPGLGVVLMNAGNVTFDLTTTPFTITFQRGTFDSLFFSEDAPDYERLCTALEGPAAKSSIGESDWGLVKRLYR